MLLYIIIILFEILHANIAAIKMFYKCIAHTFTCNTNYSHSFISPFYRNAVIVQTWTWKHFKNTQVMSWSDYYCKIVLLLSLMLL